MDRLQNLDFIIACLMEENPQLGHKIPASLQEKQRLMRALMNVRQPMPASEAFLHAQDEELRQQADDKGIVTIDGKGLLIWQGDITRLKVDAIVNAANAQMLGCWTPLHACIDNCIHSAAGVQLREACNTVMKGRLLPTGKAVITAGYNLPARHVIHTVGPIIDAPVGVRAIPSEAQQKLLADCYRNCLRIAEQHQLESIAFCCISTGVFRFPNELAAEIAVRTVREFDRRWLKTIVFNVFLDKDYDIYQRLLM